MRLLQTPSFYETEAFTAEFAENAEGGIE